MPSMKVVHVPKAGADFEVAERDIPERGHGRVRIRVPADSVRGVFGRERRAVRGGHEITVIITAGRKG